MSDPDYEAQFARGYTGPPIVPPTHVEREEAPAVLPDPTSGVEKGAADRSGSSVDPAAPESPEQVELDFAPPRPGRNPWSIALLVASVAMVAAGATLLRMYATTNANGYGLADQTAVLLMQSNLGAALITAGIVGLIAWLVLRALRGGDRRGSR